MIDINQLIAEKKAQNKLLTLKKWEAEFNSRLDSCVELFAKQQTAFSFRIEDKAEANYLIQAFAERVPGVKVTTRQVNRMTRHDLGRDRPTYPQDTEITVTLL